MENPCIMVQSDILVTLVKQDLVSRDIIVHRNKTLNGISFTVS